MGLINWLFPQGFEYEVEDPLCRCEHLFESHGPNGQCMITGCGCRAPELLIEDLGCGC